jgi:hypothetical protein
VSLRAIQIYFQDSEEAVIEHEPARRAIIRDFGGEPCSGATTGTRRMCPRSMFDYPRYRSLGYFRTAGSYATK